MLTKCAGLMWLSLLLEARSSEMTASMGIEAIYASGAPFLLGGWTEGQRVWACFGGEGLYLIAGAGVGCRFHIFVAGLVVAGVVVVGLVVASWLLLLSLLLLLLL